MDIRTADLLKMAARKRYDVVIKRYDVSDNLYLRALENVEGHVTFFWDPSEELFVNYDLSGFMICPCAITLEDVEEPFSLGEEEPVTFEETEEGFLVRDGDSIEELVYRIVFPEVPIKVVKKEKIEYSRGDGWAFVSEEDFRNERIDPRLAKLKEYKFEEEE